MQLRKDFISAKQDVIQQVRKYSSARLKEYRYLTTGKKALGLSGSLINLRQSYSIPAVIGCCGKRTQIYLQQCMADPERFYVDPYLTFCIDAGPDPSFSKLVNHLKNPISQFFLFIFL